jgi:hypothetical protein
VAVAAGIGAGGDGHAHLERWRSEM